MHPVSLDVKANNPVCFSRYYSVKDQANNPVCFSRYYSVKDQANNPGPELNLHLCFFIFMFCSLFAVKGRQCISEAFLSFLNF